MPSVALLLAVSAFILTIVSAAWGKVPLWIAVLLLSILALLQLYTR